MVNLTPEEKRVVLFLLILAFCGVVFNNLAKLNCHIKKLLCAETCLIRLNLNRISLEELLKTKSLPIKISQRIIDYRLEHGGFGSLDDLKEVKGIGNKRYDKLKEIFYVE